MRATPTPPAWRLDAALDGALVRLADARMIIGHGPWVDGRTIGRRLQVRARSGMPAHLLIATLAPPDDHPGHDGPCPPAAMGAVLRIFDPACGPACPGCCGGEAAFLAQRLSRALAGAMGESSERVARIIRNAPPVIPVTPAGPLSLVDVLFA